MVATALAFIIFRVLCLEALELRSFDLRLRWRPGGPPQGRQVKALIVAIDEKTIGPNGLNRWPLPRGEYARLIRLLDAAGAHCAGFDLLFEDPDPEDDDLAAAVRAAGNVYLGVRFLRRQDLALGIVGDPGDDLQRSRLPADAPGRAQPRLRLQRVVMPPPALSGAARALGSITINRDLDGTVRRFPVVAPRVTTGGRDAQVRFYASLPLLMAADVLGVPLEEVRVRPGKWVQIGSRRVPINESGEMVIRYYGPYHTLHQLSYIDVAHGRAYPPSVFRGRAVVLGNTCAGGFDDKITPFGGEYPGVEVQATVLQNILDGSGIATPVPWVNWLLALAGGLGVGLTRRRSVAPQLAATGALALGVLALGYALLAAGSLWVDTARPILAIVVAWVLVSADTYREAQWARARVEGAVATLAEVARAIAHTRDPSALVPALEVGLGRVLDARAAWIEVSDEWLREQLGILDAGRESPDGGTWRLPLRLGEREVGGLAIRTPNGAPTPTLGAAATLFASLALENAALLEETRGYFFDMVRLLAEITESRDAYTAGHCARVMKHAVEVGTRLSLSPEAMQELRYAALLHDVGKAVLDRRILNKPGTLSREELNEVRRHPALGRQWLLRQPRLRPLAEVVGAHHECWDGTGYPAGLAGEEIPLHARILAVVDVWDALTTNRPYRPALSAGEARERLAAGRGVQFDPLVVDAFLDYMDALLILQESPAPLSPV